MRPDLLLDALVHIRTWDNPLETAHVYQAVPAGDTVYALLLAHGFSPDVIASSALQVAIDGHPVLPAHWQRLKPKAGRLVMVRLVPLGGGGGGGGKNILRTVLQLAIVAAAVYTGGLAAGAAGFAQGTFGFAAINAAATAGAYFVGNLALNAIIPPPKPELTARGRDEDSSPNLKSITGAGNQANLYGAIPRVYGRMRVFPPYAAQPYTETAGDDQYLNLLFTFGYGPLVLSDLRIGDVPLAQFEDVEVEIREGRTTDAPLSLFRSDVAQEAFNLKVTAGAGAQEIVTALQADEATLDLTFDGLIRVTSSASEEVTVEARVEYRLFGSSSAWTPIGYSTTVKGTADMTLLAADAGQPWTGWRTAYPTAGSVKVTLTCPATHQTSAGVTRLWGLKYKVFSKASDQTAWKQVYMSPDWLRAGEDVVVDVAGFAQRQTDIRVEVAEQSWFTGTPALAVNGGGYRMAPNAKAWQYDTYQLVDGRHRFTGKTQGAVRRSVRLKFPGTGQYSVRVTRLTADRAISNDQNTIRDEMYITALSSVRNASPVNEPGSCLVAMRIRATDQLNGVIDRFSAVVQAVLPVWNGNTWVEKETRNPAWAYCDILRGKANGRPLADNRLDLTALKAWADACDAAPPQPAVPVPEGAQVSVGDAYWMFDGVIDYRTSVFDALKQVAASCRASFAMKDGKFTVVRDRPQTVPVQHFTPRNSIGFSGSRTFAAAPHGLKVRFLNEKKNWEEDEITVYRDGYTALNASRFETLELFGVTRQPQAWREGRYHLAAGQLRPDSYTLDVDIEHLAATTGDLVRVVHDVVSWGQGFGRIKTATQYDVTLDTPVTMQGGTAYALRFRLADGRSIIGNPVTVAGEQTFITLATVLAPGDVPAPGDLFLFGLWGQDSQELLVKEIQPQRDLSARLILVDAAPLVHQADSGVIPGLDDATTSLRFAPPAVSNLRLFEDIEWQNGEPIVVVRARWAMPPSTVPAASFEVFVQENGEPFRLTGTVTGRETEIGRRFDIGDAVTVRVVSVARDGSRLPLSAAAEAGLTVTVDPLSFPPGNVTEFRTNMVGDTAHFTFTPVKGYRLSHYQVRFAPVLSGATWNASSPLIERLSITATSFSAPALVGTYLIKAVNQRGIESAAPALVSSAVAGLAGFNAIADLTEHPAFTGGRSNVTVGTAGLRLAGSDTFDSWSSLDALPDIDTGSAGLVTAGTYEFASTLDLGDVYTSRVTATLEASGADVYSRIDAVADIDALPSWDGTDASGWQVILEVSLANEAIGGGTVWSAWQPFVIGDYTARAFRFRVRLLTSSRNVTPVVSALAVSIDMPDRVQGGDDLVCPPAGLSIVFDAPFKARPALAIAAQNMATGDIHTITAITATGFNIVFRDSGGTGVTRTFDYVAKGYGRVTTPLPLPLPTATLLDASLALLLDADGSALAVPQ